MKALEKNQNFVLGRKSSSAISKRSFGFETCPASKLLQKSFAFLTGYNFWSSCKMFKAKEEEELRTKTDNLRQKFYHSNSNIQVHIHFYLKITMKTFLLFSWAIQPSVWWSRGPCIKQGCLKEAKNTGKKINIASRRCVKLLKSHTSPWFKSSGKIGSCQILF